MIHHHILSNDRNYQLEFLRAIKQRRVDQKFMYFSSNAQRYYEFAKSFSKRSKTNSFTVEDFVNTIKKYTSKSRSTAIVSIGCGNSEIEKNALIELNKEGKKVAYFGVDTSRAMLQLSEDNMKGLPYEISFVQADFMSWQFINEINHITEGYDERIFVCLDNIIGNLSQTEAVDSLYNVLQKNEILLLETTIREGVKKEDDLKLFKHFMEGLNDKALLDFLFFPLKRLNLDITDGRMVIDTFYDEFVGAIGGRFSFQMQEHKVVSVRNQELHLLAPEKIHLVSLRSYDQERLANFFEGHDFSLQGKELKGRRGLFAFKKF